MPGTAQRDDLCGRSIQHQPDQLLPEFGAVLRLLPALSPQAAHISQGCLWGLGSKDKPDDDLMVQHITDMEGQARAPTYHSILT